MTPSPETGATPSTLVLYRADLVPGKEASFAQMQAEIVRVYANAGIPVYWLALQSVTNSPHVLYFDGYDSFAAVEQAGVDIAQGLKAHPELVALQQKLQEYVSGPRTMLAFRRDDLGYRLMSTATEFQSCETGRRPAMPGHRIDRSPVAQESAPSTSERQQANEQRAGRAKSGS